jgi:hypothetical protein
MPAPITTTCLGAVFEVEVDEAASLIGSVYECQV